MDTNKIPIISLKQDLSISNAIDILHILLKCNQTSYNINETTYCAKTLVHDITSFLTCIDGYDYAYINNNYASIETLQDNNIVTYDIFVKIFVYLCKNDLIASRKISKYAHICDNLTRFPDTTIIKGMLLKRVITYNEARHILCNILNIEQYNLGDSSYTKDELYSYKHTLIIDINALMRGDISFKQIYSYYADDEKIYFNMFPKLFKYLISKNIIAHD